MAITPKYSWPLPDGPDEPNVPFYLTELATAQEATVAAAADAVSGTLVFSDAVAVGASARLTAVASSVLYGGVTHDGAGRLILNRRGLYVVSGLITTPSSSIPWIQATVQDDAATKKLRGTIAPGSVVGGSSLATGSFAILTVPFPIGLWLGAPTPLDITGNGNLTYLSVWRIGDLP